MAEAKKTLSELSQLLIVPSPNAGEKAAVIEDTAEDEIEEPGDDDQIEARAEDTSDDDQSEDDTDEQSDDAEDDKDEQADDDAEDVLQIDDDDLIEVKIDGQVVFRSIADAKKALSGEGAIEKRLQEATETRKTAQAERTQLLEQMAQAQNLLISTINDVQGAIFTPVVDKPSLALREKDPKEYVRQLERYERDQERVEKGKAKVIELLGRQKQKFDNEVEEYRKQQGQLLAQSLPQLGDKDKGPKLLNDMRDTAVNIYGYSPQEVAMASDHRLYRLVHDAMMYQKLRKNGKAEVVKDVSGQKAKQPRKMRAGNNMGKQVLKAKTDARQKALEQARKSGKPQDIAKTLLM
jgi:hypothetical protein